MIIPFYQMEEAVAEDPTIGFCLNCGAKAYGVEPDARDSECEVCVASAVYGSEELQRAADG